MFKIPQKRTAPFVDYVVVHPQDGIYLGDGLGMSFFSKLDAAGQTSACTFPTEAQVQAVIRSLEEAGVTNLSYRQVTAQREGYATIAECEAAGLEGWTVDA